MSTPLTLGIVIFPDVEELDFVGPWEVFTMAEKMGLPLKPTLVAQSLDPVTCAKGMRVLPDHNFANCPQLDIITVPGGQGTRTGVENAELIRVIGNAAKSCQWVTSVCTGAALLGKAGLVDGKRLTTHWNAMDFVKQHAGDATLIDDQRVVVDGNLMSSAGVSAGIDMALTLIGALSGEDAARDVQKHMEYYPEPPFGGTHPAMKAKS